MGEDSHRTPPLRLSEPNPSCPPAGALSIKKPLAMKLAKPAGGLSHIQPPPDGASKAGGGPFCESGHRAWYPGNDCSQAPGGCPCSSRNGGAGPRAWYPGEGVCSGPRRVPLQPQDKGSRTPLRHRLPVRPPAPRGRGSTVRTRTFPQEEEDLRPPGVKKFTPPNSVQKVGVNFGLVVSAVVSKLTM